MGIGSLDGWWWGHTGEGLGFSSLVMYHAETFTSIVIFMNISDVADPSDSETNVHVPTVLMREYAGILSGEGRTPTDPRPPRPESEPLIRKPHTMLQSKPSSPCGNRRMHARVGFTCAGSVETYAGSPLEF